MRITDKYTAARVGAGIEPSIICQAEVEVSDSNMKDILGITFTNVEMFQNQGDAMELRKRLDEITEKRKRERHMRVVDLIPRSAIVAVTESPKMLEILSRSMRTVELRTGNVEKFSDRESEVNLIGRLLLLSNTSTLLARGILKFKTADTWPDVKRALTNATKKEPRMDTDGLILTNLSQDDAIALTVCLLCYWAVENPPRIRQKIDYTLLDMANGTYRGSRW